GYCLGPTHEEAVTELVAAQSNLSYKQLPLRLYQVTRKFRDEPKPRFGLLRSREFYMKDMYTFDASQEAARQTYDLVGDAYRRLFDPPGLVLCPGGHFAANVETLNGEQTSCPACGEKLTQTRGIEVGHTFYLGTKYSSVSNAIFYSAENKPQLAEMGCYGLGVTRILAASIELAGDSVLDDRTQLTIGKRLKDANKLGYPYVVIAGKGVCDNPPVFEVWNQNAGEVLFLTKEGVIELLSKVQVP
ncbi:hypothetical protein N338_10208, partial [Podiceps cristatus]